MATHVYQVLRQDPFYGGSEHVCYLEDLEDAKELLSEDTTSGLEYIIRERTVYDSLEEYRQDR